MSSLHPVVQSEEVFQEVLVFHDILEASQGVHHQLIRVRIFAELGHFANMHPEFIRVHCGRERIIISIGDI